MDTSWIERGYFMDVLRVNPMFLVFFHKNNVINSEKLGFINVLSTFCFGLVFGKTCKVS